MTLSSFNSSWTSAFFHWCGWNTFIIYVTDQWCAVVFWNEKAKSSMFLCCYYCHYLEKMTRTSLSNENCGIPVVLIYTILTNYQSSFYEKKNNNNLTILLQLYWQYTLWNLGNIWVTDALQLQLASSYKWHFMTLILYLYSKLTVNNHWLFVIPSNCNLMRILFM